MKVPQSGFPILIPMPSTTLSYLGHATMMIEIDGLNILTDPVFGDRVLHLRRRSVSAGAWFADQPEPDLILLSHLHLDHLHLPTLRRLSTDTPMLVPPGTARWLQPILVQKLIEIAPGKETQFNGVTIHATPALHGNNTRNLFFDRTQGYLIEGSHTIYYPGDTDLFPEMVDLGNHGLDLALMPIWGWGPTLGNGHLNPERAAEALTRLRPQYAIPIHWATFRPFGFFWEYLSYLNQPGAEFISHAAEKSPGTKIHLLNPGDAFVLE